MQGVAAMRRFILPPLTAIVVGVFLVIGAPPAYACPPNPDEPSLETKVADADFILIATITRAFIDPPLDASTPDDLLHSSFVELEATEHLKGTGPTTMVFSTGADYYFTETGELDVSVIDCPEFRGGPKGMDYVLLLSQPGDSIGILASAPLDTQWGQEFLQQVRDILAGSLATPTPTPQPSPTPEPTASPTPAVLPAVLPPTGTAPGGQGSHVLALLVSAGAGLAASAWLLRRASRV